MIATFNLQTEDMSLTTEEQGEESHLASRFFTPSTVLAASQTSEAASTLAFDNSSFNLGDMCPGDAETVVADTDETCPVGLKEYGAGLEDVSALLLCHVVHVQRRARNSEIALVFNCFETVIVLISVYLCCTRATRI